MKRSNVTSVLEPAPILLNLSDPRGAQLALVWQSQAPKFQGDFHVYIWQNYRDPPQFEYADILLLSSRRVIISFKSSRLLKNFTSMRLNQAILGSDLTGLHPWSPSSEVLLSILTVYKGMVNDTENFIQESMHGISAMVRPSD